MNPALRMFLTLIVGACASFEGLAQEPTACPTVTIASAAEVNARDVAEFKVSVTGGSADVFPLYNWSLSAGTLVAGQGTSTIQVDANGMAGGDVIKAMVEVLGYPGSCDTSASASMTVVTKAYRVFEGAYTDDAQIARLLDALIGERASDAKAYIVFYAGSAAPAGEVDRLKQVAKAHIDSKGENPADYPFMDGGERPQTTIEIWLAGPGDKEPQLGTAD